MIYCSKCGNQLADSARFCNQCGTSLQTTTSFQPPNSGVSMPPPPPAMHVPLDYTIQGDNLQVIRIRLQPGQELFAEAGKMLYKYPQVSWETRMSGQSIGEKLIGALKRKLMGES